MSDRPIRGSKSRPRPMVVPPWPITVSSLTAIVIMVKANTSPADVTTSPVPPIARMMPVFRPAWISSLNRETSSRLSSDPTANSTMIDIANTIQCSLAPRMYCQTSTEIKQISTAAVTSLADAIEDALPALERAGEYAVILAAYSLAAPLWRVPTPPKKLAEAYAEAKATDLPPDWNIDFTSALTRLITATCVGLMTERGESSSG